MNITIWSDFVCPFCYIGEAHLNKALEELALQDKVKVEYKSFLLNPEAEYREGETYYDAFAREKNMSKEQTKVMMQRVIDMAHQAGLTLNYDIAKNANTLDAHRVFQYAKDEGKNAAYFERLYEAHFNEGAVMSDHATLKQLAQEIGLATDKIADILNSEENLDRVDQDIEQARYIGVQGVPFYVIDNKYAISGAQPVDVFKEVLIKADTEA